MCKCGNEMTNDRQLSTVNCQLPTAVANRQPKQTAGNYSSPAAQDIGKTKIFDSNKGAGVD